MRSWTILLSGLIVWAAHFFLLYGIGEFAGTGRDARIAVGAITLSCLSMIALLVFRLVREVHIDAFAIWRTRLALTGLILGGLAVVWQALPAILAH